MVESAPPKKNGKEEVKKEEPRGDVQDPNYNPLLHNGITNKDVSFFQITYKIFRTLLFHFKTDNFIPIDGAAKFVVNLLKRPKLTEYDEQAEQRFFDSLVNIMEALSVDKKTLTEDQFC